MNHLEDMWHRQLHMDMKTGIMDKLPNRQERLLRRLQALQNECSELAVELGYKWWKGDGRIQEGKAQMELIDCFHFLLGLATEMFGGAEHFYQTYLEKNKINHERKDFDCNE